MDTIITIIIYFTVLNILGFTMMGIDKYRARNRQFRISERSLFLIAILGGSIGSILGMFHFRHKTKHLSFKIGLPLILILQITAIMILLILNINIVFI